MLAAWLLWPLVRAHGQAVVINPIPSFSAGAGSLITLTVSVAAIPAGGVTFGHGGFAPPNSFPINALLDSTLGIFAWTPTTNQLGPFNITVWAYAILQPANSNFTTFTITVTNPAPPVTTISIDPIPPQTVAEGTTLSFTSTAHDVASPATPLVFSLVNAPAGASISNNTLTSGVFTWTPTSDQALNPVYTIREVVTEPSTLTTNFQDFQVTVTRSTDCAQLDAFLAAVLQGGYFMLSNCSTIVLTNTLIISKSVTLDAGTNAVAIAGNNLSRLFTVLPGVTNFTLRGLTLSGGQDPTGGGALYVNQGAVAVLTNCLIIGNSATGYSGVAGKVGSDGVVQGQNGGNGTAGLSASGGAIRNLGTLIALNCQFTNNSASGGSGGGGGGGGNSSGVLSRGGNGGNGGKGASGQGGAIYNQGSLLLSNCTFSGNSASGGSGGAGGTNGTAAYAGYAGSGGAGMEGSGAAVYNANNAIVSACTFSGNIGQGGSSAAGGTDSNTDGVSGAAGAVSLGGGFCNVSVGLVTNCTFSTNQVTGGNGGDGGTGTGTLSNGGNGGNGGNGLGGGLYSAGTIAVVNCTFSGNSGVGGTNGVGGGGPFAGTAGTPGRGHGGDIADASGTFSLRNTILGASSGGTNAYDTSSSRITDGGYNISSDASLNLSGTSHKNTDPKLGPLADNGGLTLTMAIPATSPAVNKIPAALAPAIDQRGIPRPQPQGGLSDIGAFELALVPVITTQPQSQTVVAGSDATFTVVAMGAPLTYQWRFNGTNIADATDSAFTVSGAQSTDTGSYSVIVSNTVGSVTSQTAFLSVSPFTISGQVLDTDGTNGLADVLVQAMTNSGVASFTSTDADGNYTLTGLDAGTYSLAASLTCFVFGPANLSVTVGPTNAAGVNLFASNSLFTVSGTITNAPAGLSVAITGTNGIPNVSISGGTYGASNVCAGFYSVVPSAPGYQFVPPTNSVQVPPSTNSVNFTAVQVFSLSGSVTNATNGPGFSGINVALTGMVATNLTTGANGAFQVGGLPPGTYVVTPTAPGCYHLNLTARTATLGPTNAAGMDFLAMPDSYTISGRLTNGGAGVSGITVSAGGANSSVTDATGSYVLSNLCAGSYTVAPSAGCSIQFSPASLPATVGPGSASGLNFSATPIVRTISGRITDGGIGAGGVSVQLGTQTSTTDAGGNYAFTNLCAGSYTVIPSAACRLFTPASAPVTLVTNASDVNFVTFSNNLSRIRGHITDGVRGLSNVVVTASGGRTTTTDTNGDYVLASLCPGAYLVGPSLSNYCFNPPSLSLAVGSAQLTNGADFVATLGVYRISGTLGSMPPGPPVTISIVSANTTNIVTTSDGSYAVPNLCAGSYTVTPSNACFLFYPTNQSTTVGPNDDSLDFNVAGGGANAIRGQVTHGGVGLGNVMVSAGGQTNVTASNGSYLLTNLCQGTYPVTAASANYQFLPATNTVTLSFADATNVNFAASAVFSLSGRVLQGANGLAGVTLSVGTNRSVTGPDGYYTNYNLLEGASVVVAPWLGGYAFAPASRSLTMASSVSGLNFMAFPSLALARASNGVVQLFYTPTFTCQVQASTNLHNWQSVFATNDVSADTLLLQFTDTDAANSPMRFYRLGETFAGAPVLTNWTSVTNSLSLGCVAAQVLTCQVQASTNLAFWTNLFSTNLPAGAPFKFGYSGATNLPVRFYRLSQTPGF